MKQACGSAIRDHLIWLVGELGWFGDRDDGGYRRGGWTHRSAAFERGVKQRLIVRDEARVPELPDAEVVISAVMTMKKECGKPSTE